MSDLSILLALHTASARLLDAYNTLVAAGRRDLALHVTSAQLSINAALGALAKERVAS